VGDLGLRSFLGLYRAAARLLAKEHFDALFITIFPAYTAMLGPMLVRRFGIPFVLDYQDPWVGAWGETVGGGVNGHADFKSRASRTVARWLEPYAVRSASAITAVSAGTYEPILKRNPKIHPITEAIPIGAEPMDFAPRTSPSANTLPFDAGDGLVHISYTGTVLPLGVETLDAVLRAVRLVRDRRPDLYRKLRLHFIGTSNQTTTTDVMRVMPLATELGISDCVQELPTRLPYSSVVEVQQRSSALLAMGSSEAHYTASKIYPLLLAKRPVLAVYHERSTVIDVLRRIARPPSVRLQTYSDIERVATRVESIAADLTAVIERPEWNAGDVNIEGLSEYFAESLAGRLASVLDRATEAPAA
jgi:hypothetical protein